MVKENRSALRNSIHFSLWHLLVVLFKLLHDKPRVHDVWIPRSLGRAYKRVVREVIRDQRRFHRVHEILAIVSVAGCLGMVDDCSFTGRERYVLLLDLGRW